MAEDDIASPSQAEEKEKKTAKKSAPKDKKASSATDDVKVKKKRYPSSHPSTEQMTIEAIENLNESEGSSVQAIKSWICDNYHTVRPDMLKTLLRNALHKGLEKGVFIRSKEVNTTAVLCGSYRLAAPAKADRDENLRSSSRIRRLEGRRVTNTVKSRRPLSMPFGKRSKKKKKQDSPSESPESSENEYEPSKKKGRSAPAPRGKPIKKELKDSTVTESDSPPKAEKDEKVEKPAEKSKEKKKSEPVKTESPKNEGKNENAKPAGRRSRKSAS